MARKRQEPEVRVIADITWVRDDPPSQSHRERWRADLPGISVFVSHYEDDRRGGNFEGWRVVAGVPGAEEHPDRDTAMEAARETIEVEARHRLAEINREIKSGQELVRLCKEAGIPLDRRPA